MSNQEEKAGIRLQVRMSRFGIASRRKCEEYIAQGRVKVNGRVVIQPGTRVLDTDEVTFDGARVGQARKFVYIALHKPAGFLCSDADPDGRPLAKDLFQSVVKDRVFHVGRLDFMSSGLIFYTNDGEFARYLTHPSSKIQKEYLVTTKNVIPEEFLERFKRGLVVDGVRYKALEAELTGPRTARVVLTEGKNRELRNVFLGSHLRVRRVHRIRIGSVALKGISAGHFRFLKNSEVKSLMGKGGSRGRSH
ncbi:MAG: pseudouridine synthase [Spirochaetales bacterium]|nr:MAG: pseudouridine synthase [Spirochaetales bacterium]